MYDEKLLQPYKDFEKSPIFLPAVHKQSSYSKQVSTSNLY